MRLEPGKKNAEHVGIMPADDPINAVDRERDEAVKNAPGGEEKDAGENHIEGHSLHGDPCDHRRACAGEKQRVLRQAERLHYQ